MPKIFSQLNNSIFYSFNDKKVYYLLLIMEKSKLIWLNGEFVNWEDAKVSVMSHTLHYGTGVFEGIRARDCKNGTSIFRLSDHVDRLYNSASAYNLDIPYDKDVITQAIKDSVHLNELTSAYIRPLVFFGEGEMGLLPNNVPVNVSVAAWSWGAYLGDEAGNNGVKVCISKWKRISPESFIPTAKGVGGYMNSTLAKIDAVNNGYDDAIMFGDGDVVAEGSGQNLFLIKNSKITTPPIETGALGGITRRTVIEIASNLGYETLEQNITKEDLLNADELFFTGTATEVIGVVSVDGEDIGNGSPGSITNAIRNKYLEIVNGNDPISENYLTLVK
jgi:branched-chain amino acid aminotransferase